jgi:putative oxidoreductase
MSRFEGVALALLRVVSAFAFMQHGAQKIFGALGGTPVPLASQFGLAGVIELVGGALILVGLFTRVAAFICSGEMAAAYFIAHLPRGFWPLTNGGEPALLFCFIFLYLWTRGAGPYSLDAMMGRAERGMRVERATS